MPSLPSIAMKKIFTRMCWYCFYRTYNSGTDGCNNNECATTLVFQLCLVRAALTPLCTCITNEGPPHQ
jgi:hypothetical protein